MRKEGPTTVWVWVRWQRPASESRPYNGPYSGLYNGANNSEDEGKKKRAAEWCR
jgi:hypothetical protein